MLCVHTSDFVHLNRTSLHRILKLDLKSQPDNIQIVQDLKLDFYKYEQFTLIFISKSRNITQKDLLKTSRRPFIRNDF